MGRSSLVRGREKGGRKGEKTSCQDKVRERERKMERSGVVLREGEIGNN